MTKTQETLRIASRAFRLLSLGAYLKPEELKTLGDLCAITLPMKYRFDKKDMEEMDQFAKTHRGHFYKNEPECVFCGAFGPIEDDEPCKSRKEIGEQVVFLIEKLRRLESVTNGGKEEKSVTSN